MFKLLLIVFFCFATSIVGYGQCHSDTNDVQCLEKLSSSQTFVKSYKLDALRNGDTEFSTVLVKDIRYYLNLCEEGEVSNNVVINVYDANRKMVSSNKSDQSVLSELSFTCDKTGVYYFVFKKGSTSAVCGLGALSFRK